MFCSTNPAKTAAALLVLKKRFKDNLNLEFMQTESGVKPTPFGVDQCIRGANNRIAQGIEEFPEAKYWIGAEGGIIPVRKTLTIGGYVVIKSRTGRSFIGSSRFIKIPDELAPQITTHKPLSETIDYSLFPPRLVALKESYGTNGLITKGKYTRINEFEDALRSALKYIS